MAAEKEKCPKRRNEEGKRNGVGMFSAPSKRPLQAMLSLPEEVELKIVETRIHQQKELGEKNEKKAEEVRRILSGGKSLNTTFA